MEKISPSQLDLLKNRYPEFELSYESMLHNKVPDKYNIVLAIPIGKKFICWFTFYKDKNVMFLMELNKEKKIMNATIVNIHFPEKMAFGTILFGVYLQDLNVFVIEDIHYYKGINTSKICLFKKYYYINEFFNNIEKQHQITFCLPVSWNYEDSDILIPKSILEKIPYQVHHVQYRCLNEIVPFLNKNYNKLEKTEKLEKTKYDIPIYIPIRSDFKKPQFKESTNFIVKADLQYDIYRLYVYGKNNTLVYYNTAFIPNYKTSVFMNKIFRKIKENENLDYIEESDDEEDFQNICEDKYVDLNKKVQMECSFSYKFKRWIPLRIVKNQRIIHVSQLTSSYK